MRPHTQTRSNAADGRSPRALQAHEMIVEDLLRQARIDRQRRQPYLPMLSFDIAALRDELLKSIFPFVKLPVRIFFCKTNSLACVPKGENTAEIFIHLPLNDKSTPRQVLYHTLAHEIIHLILPPRNLNGKDVVHHNAFWWYENHMVPHNRLSWAWICYNFSGCLRSDKKAECTFVKRNWRQYMERERCSWEFVLSLMEGQDRENHRTPHRMGYDGRGKIGETPVESAPERPGNRGRADKHEVHRADMDTCVQRRRDEISLPTAQPLLQSFLEIPAPENLLARTGHEKEEKRDDPGGSAGTPAVYAADLLPCKTEELERDHAADHEENIERCRGGDPAENRLGLESEFSHDFSSCYKRNPSQNGRR